MEFDWRPLIYLLTIAVFMLLWLMGCTLISDSRASSPSTPSAYPQVTLTVGRLEQTLLPTDSPRPPHYTTTPVITDTSPATHSSPPQPSQSAALPLVVTAPICYESATGRVSCLGRVENPLAVSVTGVTVGMRLFQAENDSVDSSTIIEQIIIPAGGAAPFRYDFAASWREYAGAVAWLTDAEIARDADGMISASVDSVRHELQGAVYSIQASIRNPHANPIQLSRAVITLLDEQQRVIGYQVVMLHQQRLLPGATTHLNASLLPSFPAREASASVYVEAHK